MKYILIIIIICLFFNIKCFQNQNNLIKRCLNESNKIKNFKIGKKDLENGFFYFLFVLIIIIGLFYLFKKCKRKNCLRRKDIYNQIIKMDFNQILI